MKPKLWRLIHLLFLFAAAVVIAAAQTDEQRKSPTPSTAPSSAAEADARTSADENIELNIAERRITRRDYQASTSVEAGEETARGLRLRVGVALSADEINVLLRNVRGRVRFRASLDRVLERLNLRRAPGAVP